MDTLPFIEGPQHIDLSGEKGRLVFQFDDDKEVETLWTTSGDTFLVSIKLGVDISFHAPNGKNFRLSLKAIELPPQILPA